MKIIHLNWIDIMGRRFNGWDLSAAQRHTNHDSKMLVWEKKSDSSFVEAIPKSFVAFRIQYVSQILESWFDLQNFLSPATFKIFFMKVFRQCEVVHCHILHNNFLNLFTLPLMARRKKVLWTLHDPWAFTGRCVHPMGCEGWKTQCGVCPDLTTPFPMKNDHSRFLFRFKQWVYDHSHFEVHVTSEWMRSRLLQSPLLKSKKIHKIPFGVDTHFFNPDGRQEARKELGILADEIVIGFRSVESPFKGFEHVREALRAIRSNGKKVCLLGFNDTGLLEEFRDQFKIVEIGWSEDPKIVCRAYKCLDVFLMPSHYESFGMMALEAQSCGVPVIAFENTAIEETVVSNETGILVPYRNTQKFIEALQSLLDDNHLRQKFATQARTRAVEFYDLQKYVQNIEAVYRGLKSKMIRRA
jgi:glycosyltransferase involved in cell wall biosynthesis